MCVTTRYEPPCKIESHYLTMHIQCMAFKQSQNRGCNNRQVETIPTMTCEKCYYHPPPPSKENGMMGWRRNNTNTGQSNANLEGDQTLDEESQSGEGGNGEGSNNRKVHIKEGEEKIQVETEEGLKKEGEGEQLGVVEEIKSKKRIEQPQKNAERGNQPVGHKQIVQRKVVTHKPIATHRKASGQIKLAKEQSKNTDKKKIEDVAKSNESNLSKNQGTTKKSMALAPKAGTVSSWASSGSPSVHKPKIRPAFRSQLVRMPKYKKPTPIQVPAWVNISPKPDPNEKDHWTPDILIRGFTVPSPVVDTHVSPHAFPCSVTGSTTILDSCVVNTVSSMVWLEGVEVGDPMVSPVVGSHKRIDSGMECPDIQKLNISDDQARAPTSAPVPIPAVSSLPKKKKAVRPLSIATSGSTICSGASIPICVRKRYADISPGPHSPIVQTSIHLPNDHLEAPTTVLSLTAADAKKPMSKYSPLIPPSPTVLTKTLRDGPFAIPHIRQEASGYLSTEDLMAPQMAKFVFVGKGQAQGWA
ncbi:hypothetical protein P154DRAFT_581799 [Amniculicola lignicola CBS 123094]|uniref:Uncharacterized protein n=1 Tax=Amniculicola lignicola CBS 123094 TaxID=1392246 RepID=A0A6A5W2L1_9PLEO|nr:hypothetical protein P154DRAFT_581799 [Amniculicola lignicola CBS 123094]